MRAIVAVVVCLGALSAASCRPSASALPDAGGASCATATKCDGTSVRICREDRTAEIIEECAPDRACSLGRCTTAACATTEADLRTVLGCTFFTFDLDNVDSDDAAGSSVLVTNPNQQVAKVALERRMNAQWQAMTTVEVAPRHSARLLLPESHLEGEGLAAARAMRITSDLPVSAEHIQSDDGVQAGVSSSGATLLLPAHVLGRRYRAISYKEVVTPRLLAASAQGSHNGAGQIVVVATADRTTVTFTPSTSNATFEVRGEDGGIMEGRTLMDRVLDEGDYLQIYGTSDGSNVSGTEIRADRPVAVFSGNISTTYGVIATGVSSPDLTHEQLLPVKAWGKNFVGVVLPPQPGVCDPLLSPRGSSKLAIVADHAGTDVTIHYPSAPEVLKSQLAAGGWVEDTTPQSFALRATGAVEVMQGMDCEPTMSSAVPTDRLHKDLYFAVLPGFDTMIGIVRHPGEPVFLDNKRVEETLFEPVGGGYDVVRLPLEPCPAAESVCTHHVQGNFGFTMRGMDVLAAWALTIPAWNICSDPDEPDCL